MSIAVLAVDVAFFVGLFVCGVTLGVRVQKIRRDGETFWDALRRIPG